MIESNQYDMSALEPGLRLFSVGLWRLAERLCEAKDGHTTWIVLAWLMDERNSLELIRSAPELADFEKRLSDFEFEITPGFLAKVKREVERTGAAISSVA
jgi:hypothetical protein